MPPFVKISIDSPKLITGYGVYRIKSEGYGKSNYFLLAYKRKISIFSPIRHAMGKVKSHISKKSPSDCPSSPNSADFDGFRYLGYTLIIACFFWAGFNDWKSNMILLDWTPLLIARWFLFTELVVLSFRWIIATHVQLGMWKDWLNNPFPDERQVYPALIILPLFLGILLIFSHVLIVITALFTGYFLINYWTQWLSNDHFSRALAKTMSTASMSEKKMEALRTMESFWTKRPQLGRIVISMFFAFVAFSLALWSVFDKTPLSKWLQLGSYGILIFDILIGEIVISIWRFKLDRQMTVYYGS